MKRITTAIAILFFVLMIPLATSSFGAVIIIPDNYATIQEGIDAALNGDTVLVRDGTYLLTAAIDFKGKAITVESEHGAGSCILDGQHTTRVVYFHGDEGSGSVLSGFTIRNGHSGQGGGIYLSASSPTISDCTIRDNLAETGDSSCAGGGIYSNASSPIISSCTIKGNSASSSIASGGGGIYIAGGHPVITNTIITNNHAYGQFGASGGGISVNASSPIIENSDIDNNSVSNFGNYGTAGGGIYFSSTGYPSLVNCIINGNSANRGGGIYFDGSPNFPGVTNCTIARNIATTENGGGIYFVNTSTDIINSILWENSPGNIYKEGTSNPNITYSDVGGGHAGTGNIDSSPAFVNIALADFHLTAASPCINTGSKAAPYLSSFDKDGKVRINGSSVDMGAYESQAVKLSVFPQMAVGGGWSTVLTVTNTGDTTASGSLILTDQAGGTLVAEFEPGNMIGSTIPVVVPPAGTVFLTAKPVNSADPSKSGWARLETTGGSLSGVVTFQYSPEGELRTASGVLESPSTQYATIPVDNDDTQQRYTGYAVANPGSEDLAVKMAVVDQIGNVVDDSLTIPLHPGEQVARFLHQDLSSKLKFKGSMVLRAQGGKFFAAVALVENQGVYTVIPVGLGKASKIPN